jgi:hypothetical protein
MNDLISKEQANKCGIVQNGTIFIYIDGKLAKLLIVKDLGDMYEVRRVQ